MKTVGVEVLPSLRALLGGSVDYAGLFPPAALALEPALDNYANYIRSGDAWMLGCFVLPMAKLADAERLLAGRFDSEHPLRISALGAKAQTADEFLENLRVGLRGLADFQQAHGAAVVFEQLEAPLPLGITPGHLLREAAGLIAEAHGALRAFWEIPFSENLPAMLRGIAQHNATAAGRPFGAKLRTGGLESGAFPTPAQLAEALIAARDAGVALKFTAGLHHPFRRYDAGVSTRMHGFVNVFVAGIFLQQPWIDAARALVPSILEDEDSANFRFEADGLRYGKWEVAAGNVPSAREFITSFGSCSFDEPRDDLRAAGLLP